MKSIDRDVRASLERNIDTILKDPKISEKGYFLILKTLGIETNLETILSFINGTMVGLAGGAYLIKYGRLLNLDEQVALMDLLKRRAWEIRQAFIGTRIEK